MSDFGGRYLPPTRAVMKKDPYGPPVKEVEARPAITPALVETQAKISELDKVIHRLLDVPVPERFSFISAIVMRLRTGRNRKVAKGCAGLTLEIQNVLANAADSETARLAFARAHLEDAARRALLKATIAEAEMRIAEAKMRIRIAESVEK